MRVFKRLERWPNTVKTFVAKPQDENPEYLLVCSKTTAKSLVSSLQTQNKYVD